MRTALACALLLPAAVRAQTAPPPETSSTASAAGDSSSRDTGTHHPTRLYVGMWTVHLKHDVLTVDNNWVIGLSWRGFFGATFLNSFGRRAFTGGIQRTLLSADPHPLGASLGFRLGFVTGYDGRFMHLARKTPVLPLVQPFASIEVQHVGIEVSYTFVVVSLAVSYRF
ncbi:MAG TPA: hypothetical protein VES67_16505 [Vicinamibacterales bacterium]|nr:hypothetical protein [Vicinamibacterales bacterium]